MRMHRLRQHEDALPQMMVSRKTFSDIGTMAAYIKQAGLGGMFTWAVNACHEACTDCLSQTQWDTDKNAGQCNGLESASKSAMS